jgi:hypothetical protein
MWRFLPHVQPTAPPAPGPIDADLIAPGCRPSPCSGCAGSTFVIDYALRVDGRLHRALRSNLDPILQAGLNGGRTRFLKSSTREPPDVEPFSTTARLLPTMQANSQ